MVKKLRDLWAKSTVQSLALGQLLSLSLIFAGFTSSQLAKKGIFAPLSQSWLSYVLLALVHGLMINRNEPFKPKLDYPTLMLTWLDLCAKIFVIGAYWFTSLTSITLLNFWTIACVMFISWLFLKTKYGLQELVGAVFCVAGLVTVFLSDLHSVDGLTGKDLVGDSFLIAGATFYGVRNVLEEIFVKKVDRVEIMANFGIFGSTLIVPHIVTCEYDKLKSILSSPEAIFLVIGYSIAIFLLYSGVSILLKTSGSTMLNLSLLTSNVWAFLIRIFAYHEKVDWIYYVAFATVTLGLIVQSGGDEMDPNIGNTASIDVEASLGHSDNVGISYNDGSKK